MLHLNHYNHCNSWPISMALLFDRNIQFRSHHPRVTCFLLSALFAHPLLFLSIYLSVPCLLFLHLSTLGMYVVQTLLGMPLRLAVGHGERRSKRGPTTKPRRKKGCLTVVCVEKKKHMQDWKRVFAPSPWMHAWPLVCSASALTSHETGDSHPRSTCLMQMGESQGINNLVVPVRTVGTHHQLYC